MTKKYELVFLPVPAAGHLLSKLEFAKLLLQRDQRLSITILIIQRPDRKLSYDRSLGGSDSSNRVKFIDLPYPDNFSEPIASRFHFSLLESHRPRIKQILTNIIKSDSILAGIVVDMFCLPMVEVANELGVNSYLYFASGANFLSTFLQIQSVHDDEKVDFLGLECDFNFKVPGIVNHVPCGALPGMVFNEETTEIFYQLGRWTREMKGIVINTFRDLESYTIDSITKAPVLYPVGPLLNLKTINDDPEKNSEIMEWLDNQPPSSVVFLCFGSMGKFDKAQIIEMAIALDRSGYRFLWSLRTKTDENPKDIIPEDIMKRMDGIGKIIEWAPQAAVLAHPSIGGFVSHCGWNSILESIWFGVPIAAWAMYAEQHINGFSMVKEHGLAVEINIDHGKEFAKQSIVYADMIEKGIREVMEIDSEVRKKMKEISEKSRKAIISGGPSYDSLGNFIEDVIKNTT